jgi:hypothetical protein
LVPYRESLRGKKILFFNLMKFIQISKKNSYLKLSLNEEENNIKSQLLQNIKDNVK